HSLGLPSLATSSVALYRGVGADTGIPWGSAEDFYRLVNGAQDEIVAPPGERFFYHNAAWRMLGNVIQAKSGIPFHRYIKERVIDPLGMSRSTLNTAEFYEDPDHIVPHWKKPDGTVEPSRFPYPNPEDNPGFSFIAAAGGIASSVNEMARYLNAQIMKGDYPGGRLASPESFERMQTLHIRRTDGFYGVHGYGYGLGVTPDFLGHKMLSHGGSILVSTAHMAFIPDLKIGVVMMGNSASLPYDEMAECILATMMGRDPMEAVPSLAIKQRMQRLTGAYDIYKGIERVHVVRKAGMLYLETKTPFTDMLQPLIPEDPTLESTMFYTLVDGAKSPVEFVVHDDGRVDLFVERYCFHKR
ncbi:serine hydrolase, partial [Candidatus Bathyarchaeota archaeon]|nr:serine hydrolase [Candidatus Bathyarchaeota archaeon]